MICAVEMAFAVGSRVRFDERVDIEVGEEGREAVIAVLVSDCRCDLQSHLRQ